MDSNDHLLIIKQAVDFYDALKKDEAVRLLDTFFLQKDGVNTDQDVYDLAMETYIFFISGDLRKSGRDFGFSNTEEIKKEITKLLDLRSI